MSHTPQQPRPHQQHQPHQQNLPKTSPRGNTTTQPPRRRKSPLFANTSKSNSDNSCNSPQINTEVDNSENATDSTPQLNTVLPSLPSELNFVMLTDVSDYPTVQAMSFRPQLLVATRSALRTKPRSLCDLGGLFQGSPTVPRPRGSNLPAGLAKSFHRKLSSSSTTTLPPRFPPASVTTMLSKQKQQLQPQPQQKQSDFSTPPQSPVLSSIDAAAQHLLLLSPVSTIASPNTTPTKPASKLRRKRGSVDVWLTPDKHTKTKIKSFSGEISL